MGVVHVGRIPPHSDGRPQETPLRKGTVMGVVFMGMTFAKVVQRSPRGRGEGLGLRRRTSNPGHYLNVSASAGLETRMSWTFSGVKPRVSILGTMWSSMYV